MSHQDQDRYEFVRLTESLMEKGDDLVVLIRMLMDGDSFREMADGMKEVTGRRFSRWGVEDVLTRFLGNEKNDGVGVDELVEELLHERRGYEETLERLKEDE